jgi:hypothetical protein
VSPKNIRRSPRVTVNFPVEFALGDRTFREHASTLSGSGLFIACQEKLDPGTIIPLHFRPANHLPMMEAEARVCYHIPGRGAALEFTEIQPEHRQLLLRLIHHKTGDKRHFPRSPLATQIESEQCLSLALSRDVSLGGMFVETSDPLPVETMLNVRFNLDDDGPVVIAMARVAYQVMKLGMGVEFLELAPGDIERLEAYIARSVILPDPTSTEARPAS